MKKLMTLVLALMMVLSCLTGVAAVAEETTTELAVGLSSSVNNFAPWEIGEPFYYTVLNNIYQPLGILIDGELENVLMTDYSTEDGYTYTVTIYEGITDTAGNAFTASDAVFSLLTSRSFAAKYAQYIEDAEVIDDVTFTVTLNSNGLGVWEGVMNYTFMVTEAAYNASDDGMSSNPVGTGAYYMTEYVAGSYYTVEKVDDYWLDDTSVLPDIYTANIDKVTYNIITESTQMDIALRQGTIQIGWKANESLVPDLKEVEGLQVIEADSNLLYYLAFNMTENSVFNDNLALRQAVLYAIDETALVTAATNGLGSVGTVMQSPFKSMYNEEWDTWDYYQYDPEKAAELLAEAGYSAGELTIVGICNGSNAMYSTMMEVIQAYLSVIGINLTIESYDAATFNVYRDASTYDYDIVILSTDALDYVGTTLANHFNRNNYESGNTLTGISDDTLQAMLDELLTTEGNTQENVNEMQTYLRDNAYAYDLMVRYAYCVYNTDILAEDPIICQTWVAATAAVLK